MIYKLRGHLNVWWELKSGIKMEGRRMKVNDNENEIEIHG